MSKKTVFIPVGPLSQSQRRFRGGGSAAAFSFQLSAISFQLSAFSFQLSAFSHQLETGARAGGWLV
jgi:hypothetical protein